MITSEGVDELASCLGMGDEVPAPEGPKLLFEKIVWSAKYDHEWSGKNDHRWVIFIPSKTHATGSAWAATFLTGC